MLDDRGCLELRELHGFLGNVHKEEPHLHSLVRMMSETIRSLFIVAGSWWLHVPWRGPLPSISFMGVRSREIGGRILSAWARGGSTFAFGNIHRHSQGMHRVSGPFGDLIDQFQCP